MIRDTSILMGRIFKHTFRTGEAWVTTLVVPVLLFLLNYFMMNAQNLSYSANEVFPLITTITILMAVSYTGHRVFEDKQKNMFVRIKSMPIHQSAFLWSHAVASVLTAMVSLLAVAGLSVALMGNTATLGQWALSFLTALAMTLALSWITIIGGLIAKSASMASAFFYILLIFEIGMMFSGMDLPRPLYILMNYQPFAHMSNGLTYLLANGTLHMELGLALIWSVGLFVLAYLYANRRYKDTMR